MADIATSRVMLISKDPVSGTVGYAYRRATFDRVTVPGIVGDCLEPVDWTGNLTLYNTDKEYTGVEIIEGDLAANFKFPHGGYTGLPKAS
jgi:hypothetical protein